MTGLLTRPTRDAPARGHRRLPPLRGLGAATPGPPVAQTEIGERLAAIWRLAGSERERWWRIVEASGIERRHAAMPLESVVDLSTRGRMEAYERHAPALAAAAARDALANAAIRPGRVTDLVIVSCTGFSAPGLDVELVERLGLRAETRRTVIGFMGCFGAITGLRSAAGVCAADRDACALVICLELCTLHLRRDTSPQNLVASALFADGAAAAVVGGDAGDGPVLGGITLGTSRLIPEGRGWMSWRITDAGFAMTLTRDVPVALRDRIDEIVGSAAPPDPGCYVVHPGGPGILDAVDQGLRLSGGLGLGSARSVLRRFGNMSSATVLFVLADALAGGAEMPALLLAFGPGLAVETLALMPAGRPMDRK